MSRRVGSHAALVKELKPVFRRRPSELIILDSPVALKIPGVSSSSFLASRLSQELGSLLDPTAISGPPLPAGHPFLGTAAGAAYWSALYGTYANWAVTVLAAIFGTAAMSPITAAGRSGQPWQEGLVTFGFTSVGIVIVASSILVLSGLRRTAELPAQR